MMYPKTMKVPAKGISLLMFLFILLVSVNGFHCRTASAGPIIKIGILEEPKTLNVWRASDTWSKRVLGKIYQPLFLREPRELKLIPWLAAAPPVYDPASLSYTLTLRTAKWSDGTEITAEDVAFTGELIKEFKVPREYSSWEFVKKIEVVDKHTVRFFLDHPSATFLARTLTTDIVQKKEWEKVVQEARTAEKPLVALHNSKVDHPVSSGPFLLKEWKKGSYLFLEKNPHFFGTGQKIEQFVLGPYIDGIVFKVYGTSDAAVLALKTGDIDLFWWGIQSGYMDDLKKEKGVTLFTNEKSGLYFLGFNLRKKPFDDVQLRRAVATLIDKDFILERVLQGHAVKMKSIIPPGNKFWHATDVSQYGEGLSRDERTKAAYEILSKAGYTWRVPPVSSDGKVVKGEGLILPDGKPMEDFTILTPPSDYDPHRAMVGMMVQEWLRMAGIPASAKPMAFGSLMEQVKSRHQFDLFVLGYGSLSLDPDYLKNFFHSENDAAGGWNMSGYRNPEFDRIADESSGEIDEQKRRKLVLEMQKIILRDVPYIPIYNPNLIEAARTDRFTGWIEMLEGIGNIWSFCQIRAR
ncbi:MAG: ABC transporter substrate-binding protein [Deltaproteobacteria bacterium HGW-Deltaproteobacteria-21]|nr:MAG: ABC transporter substrate-binding protein [Deltaproteobacteria bacterium HGW-Deltaproteobacteria-21]